MTGRDHRHDLVTAVFRDGRAAGDGMLAAREAALSVNRTQCDPPLPDEVVDHLIAAALVAEGDAARVEQVLTVEADKSFPLSDLGNAERHAAAHRHVSRHVPEVGWFIWDTRRYARDTDGAAMRLAGETVRAIPAEAAAERDGERRKQLLKHALTSESEPALRRMLSLAATRKELVTPLDQFDADPWVLNAENGVICLRTGERLAHDPARLCSKIAAAEYDISAIHPAWEKFLHHFTGGDRELEAFLQRAVGSTLIGGNPDQRLYFLHGPGATGKSTFIRVVSTTLGDYGTTADFDTFLARKDVGAPRPDLARLAGARMVSATEVEDGRKLAESVIKSLTGGDRITARFLHAQPFEYDPQFTPWMAANRRPAVDANDTAMWRRIVQVPCTNVIPESERDASVIRTLTDDPDARAAVLAWAVQGCLQWQDDGLRIPATVRAYTDDYRRENDALALWLADRTETDPRAMEPVAALRASYEAWVDENGERPVGAKKFAEGMRAHGYQNGKTGTNGVRVWQGLKLTTGTTGATAPDSGKSLVSDSYTEVSENGARGARNARSTAISAIHGIDEGDQ